MFSDPALTPELLDLSPHNIKQLSDKLYFRSITLAASTVLKASRRQQLLQSRD